METAAIRVVLWTTSLLGAGAAFGMAWATQTIEVPLWSLLVLTFIPTSDLIDVAQDVLDALAAKAKHKEKKQ